MVTASSMTKMLQIYIDADGCPVREQVYQVAQRHGLIVQVVTCGNIRIPLDPRVTLVLVEPGPDSADDWIATHIGLADICITADVPLASRCLRRGAQVLSPIGRRFTADNIGAALAARDLSAHLRELGVASGGPAAFSAKDRSRFSSALENLVRECAKT